MARRILLLVVAASLLLTVGAGVALAKNFQCKDANCYGTNNNDRIKERQGSKQDDIHAKGRHDRVNAGLRGNDTDVTRGQNGRDRLNTADGDSRDVVICGSGRDFAIIDEGDIFSGCEAGIVFEDDTTAGAALDPAQGVSEVAALKAARAALN